MNTFRTRRPRATIAAIAVAATLALAATLGLAGCGGLNIGAAAPLNTAGEVDFNTPLPIPPAAAAHTDANGEKVFDLTAQAGTTEFSPGVRTRTLGFNGTYLGPTIIADRGDDVRVNVTNRLKEATTVHWHGMHLPARMDGGPHQTVGPGNTWSPHWRIDQPAATLWYHPHPHGETEKQVRMGMAGMVILKDAEEAALDLPREYGVDDIPVIVQDAHFDGNGQFDAGARGFTGSLGDTVLVNGAKGAYLPVTTDLVRLRLLNASSARVYDFGFSDQRSFDLIGTDGGLLTAPAPMEGIRLSPGERAEMLVRLSPGESVTLRSTPPDLGAPKAAANGGADTLDVLQLRAADALAASGAMPTTLASFQRMSPAEASVTRSFELDGFNINNRQMDMGRIDTTVELGSTELWKVINTTGSPHSFHVHDVQFQVVSVGGAPPQPELAGWKDTVYLTPRTEFALVMRFTDYSDPNMPYMYHCHLLFHEDQGMMGQFVVVKPGQRAGTPPAARDGAGDAAVGSGPRDQEAHHEH